MDSRLNAYLPRTQTIKRSLVTTWWLQHPTAEAPYPTTAASRPHNRNPIMPGRTATVYLRSSARTRGCIEVHNTSQRYAAETSKGTCPSTLPEQPQPQKSELHRLLGGHCVPHSTSHTHQPFTAFIDDNNHQSALKPPKPNFV